jgi:hypothetical protein
MFELDPFIYIKITVYILGLSVAVDLAIVHYLSQHLKLSPCQVLAIGDSLFLAEEQLPSQSY